MSITKDNITGAQLDTLIGLVERGPLEDGDVSSKSGLYDLVDEGLAAKILIKGKDGYNAATYKGRVLYCEYYNASNTEQAYSSRIAKVTIIKASHNSRKT